MSDCCSVPGSELQRSGAGRCPACGIKGKAVPTLTVKQLVLGHTRVAKDKSYLFCRTSDCDVVYFASDSLFRKADIKVRVGVKEHSHPVTLCYCFGYTREDIRRDTGERLSPEIPKRIKVEIQSGFCACEVKNPSGTCCLGEVARAIQKCKQDMKQTVSVDE